MVNSMNTTSLQELRALQLVLTEMRRGLNKFGKYNSSHEAYAIIKEELDELWSDIKANNNKAATRLEAIQVAATALRFVVEF